MNQIFGDPMAALEEREKPAPRPIRFDELTQEFLKHYRSRGDSGYYEHVSKSWLDYFGKTDVATIKRLHVENFRDHLRSEEYGDSSIRKYVGALGTMFRWAIGRGLLTQNPTEGVKRPRSRTRRLPC